VNEKQYINQSSKEIDFYVLILIAMAFCVSFDIFLTVSPFGFTLRFAQLLLVVPILFFVANTLIMGKIKMPVGGLPLLIWLFFMILFVPNTPFLERSVGYVFWLALNILMIFAGVLIVNSEERFLKLIKWYIYSFVFVSMFGIIQFILPILGIEPPLVQQWWSSSIARVNGFSYEPSYFATYILIGWVLTFYLHQKRIKIVSKKRLNIILLILTFALVLSSSRMGILMMGLWFARYVFLLIRDLFKGYINLKFLRILFLPTLFLGVAFLILYVSGNLQSIDFLLAGTGIFDSSAHSVNHRSNQLFDTFLAFKESPWIGYSIGGVAPAIGGIYNIKVVTQESAAAFEGMSIFAQVLAASGIVGFLFFIWYILKLVISPLKLAKNVKDEKLKNILIGLVLSTVFLLIILQMNQNILRMYFWFHLMVLSVGYSVISKNTHIK